MNGLLDVLRKVSPAALRAFGLVGVVSLAVIARAAASFLN